MQRRHFLKNSIATACALALPGCSLALSPFALSARNGLRLFFATL
jgi:hypothetical protein